MDVGRAAAAATVSVGTANQGTSRAGGNTANTENAPSILSFVKGGDRHDTNAATSQAVAGQGRRQQDGRDPGAREKEQILAQAMDLLADLEAIDPNRLNGVLEHARQRPAPQPEERQTEDADDAPSDPSSLFGYFAKSLQQSIGQLSWGTSRHLSMPAEAIERLKKVAPAVNDAGGWWYRRTLGRGQAEAQLQELKYYVQWLCERGPGLSILLGLAQAHGRAVGSLLLEVDVLQRIMQDAIKRIAVERPHAHEIVGQRRTQSSRRLAAHAEAGEHANRSVEIIEHLNEQLLGVQDVGMEAAPVNGSVGMVGELETLQAQLRLFRPVATVSNLAGNSHTAVFDQVIADIQEVVTALPEGTDLEQRWRKLDATASLLLVRLHSASSWVDGATLAAIQVDVMQALELAVSACKTDLHRQIGSNRAIGT